MRFDLPGAFPENKMAGSVNGSFWTLPGEIRVYVVFAILALSRIAVNKHNDTWGRRLLVVAACIALLVLSYFNHSAMPIILDHPSYAEPTRYFLLGMIAFYMRAWIPLNGAIAIGLIVIQALSVASKDLFLFAMMFTTTYALFYIGYQLKYMRLDRFIGDWSYGIYLYGWFAQQIVASFSRNQTALENEIFSMALAILFGALSWRFVERPMLYWSKQHPLTILKRRSLENVVAG